MQAWILYKALSKRISKYARTFRFYDIVCTHTCASHIFQMVIEVGVEQGEGGAEVADGGREERLAG